MNLKSFGCSFIFGSDLADANDWKNPLKSSSNNTWPGLVANKLGYNYQCYALPGAGNLQIVDRVLMHSTISGPTDLFVVGWTWIDRYDYRNRHYEQQLRDWEMLSTDAINWPNIVWPDWVTIRPSEKNNLSKMYYQQLHSEYQDKLTCLSYIKLTVDTLLQKNIPFIMTYMDELLFDQHHNTTPAVTYLQEYIQPHLTTFDSKTFLDWSRANGYPESSNWHPLEESHRAAADYMLRVFDKQKINAQVR
jgi:hypothetical protein